MVAGHVSATLDEGTGGDVGGHMPFLLASPHGGATVRVSH